MHNQRQQPCSRTALWNLSSVAQLECPALCRRTYDLDCWNTSSRITGTSTHPWPVFVYPPWPGGVSREGRGSTGCGWCHTSTRRPPQAHGAGTKCAHPYPRRTTAGRCESRSAALPPAGPPYAAQEREQGTASARPPTVPPAADHVHRHKRIDEPEHIHQLFHRLRHRRIKQRDHRHVVDNLLHGAPLHPLLRSRHVKQTVWPGATGGRHVIHVHRIVHGACRLGRGMPPDLRRKVQLEIPLPGLGLILSP